MKSIQLMLLGFLACFFGPLSFGLVEEGNSFAGTSDAAPETLNPPTENNVSSEDVEDPLPPDEKKPQETEDVRPIGCGASEPVAEEDAAQVHPLADVPATTVA